MVLDSLVDLYNNTSPDSSLLKSTLAGDIAWEYLYVEPDKTKEFSQLALDFAQKANSSFAISTAHGSFGLYYDVTGDYDAAIESYLKAITILEKLPEHALNLSANYHNLSLIFMNIQDWDKAILYAKKALKYDLENNKYQGQVYVYMNIAAMFGTANNIDSSLFYHKLAVSTGKKYGIEDYKIDYVNLADIELDRDNYDSAKYYLDIYLNYAQTAPSSRKLNRLAYGMVSQTRLLIETKNSAEAKIVADSAAKIVAQLKSPKLRISVLQNYSQYYVLIKDFENALKYFKQKEKLQDSITRLALREKIEIVEARYQKEKQFNEINQLKANNEISELQITKSDSQRMLFLIISILALVTLAIFSYLFVHSKKNSQRLKLKNDIIGNLIQESHHRIKNNLQVVSSLLNMQSKKALSKEAQVAINEAHHRVKTIALLHQSLQGSKDFESISLNEFLENLSKSIISGMAPEGQEIKKDFSLQPVIVKTDKAIAMGLLLNELITNSLKYAMVEGKELHLKLVLQEEETMLFQYSDNGPGLAENLNLEDSDSLGFTIINSIVTQLDAQLKVNNRTGFEAIINIPYEH